MEKRNPVSEADNQWPLSTSLGCADFINVEAAADDGDANEGLHGWNRFCLIAQLKRSLFISEAFFTAL